MRSELAQVKDFQGTRPLRASQERGAVMVLVAVLAAFVVLVLLGLGIDTARVRWANQLIANYADTACYFSVDRATLQVESTQTFRYQAEVAAANLGPLGITLTKANFYTPTYPSEGDFEHFAFSTAASAPMLDTLPFAELLGSTNTRDYSCSFNCAGVSGCTSDCFFVGDLSLAQGFPNDPERLWNNLQSVGNTVGCELEAVVDTYFRGEQPVTGRAIWKLRLASDDPDPEYDENDPAGTIRPLVIIAAPHMTTNLHRLLRFDRQVTPAGHWNYDNDDPNFLPRHDPIFSDDATSFTPPPPPGSELRIENMFEFAQPERTVDGETILSPKEVSARCYGGEEGGAGSGTCFTMPGGTEQTEIRAGRYRGLRQTDEVRSRFLGGNFRVRQSCDEFRQEVVPDADSSHWSHEPKPNVNCSYPSDHELLVSSCMSPPIMIRNILLSTIVELASRRGDLRQNTALLLAGTQRPLVNFGNYPQSDVGVPRPASPVRIVDIGQDLAAEAYETPFVTYDGSEGPFPGSAQTRGMNRKGAYVNPFDASQPDLMRRHFTLLSNQLRYCYHLYYGEGTNIDDRGLYRPPLGFDSRLPKSRHFEPSLFLDRTDIEENISPIKTNIAPAVPHWDQESPFGEGYTAGQSRALRASEVMATLGAVQTCPYQEVLETSDGTLNGDPTRWCEKPLMYEEGSIPAGPRVTEDLKPDLLGAVSYATRRDFDDVNGVTVRGLEAPGLFPGADPTNEVEPFPAPRYAEIANGEGALFIVTHRALTARETVLLDEFWTEANADQFEDRRRVIVVYIPTTIPEAQQWAIDRFRRAFHIPETAVEEPRANKLYVLSPFHDLTDNGANDPSSLWGDANIPALQNIERFRWYWQYLLTDPEDNIHVRARQIFRDLFERELKL